MTYCKRVYFEGGEAETHVNIDIGWHTIAIGNCAIDVFDKSVETGLATDNASMVAVAFSLE